MIWRPCLRIVLPLVRRQGFFQPIGSADMLGIRETPRKCSPGFNTKGDLLLYRCNWNIYSVSWGAQLDELLYFGCYLNLQLDG